MISKISTIFKSMLLLSFILSFNLQTPEVFAKSNQKDEIIHFLATGSSDAILIESNGRFGLVDSGEDSANSSRVKSMKARRAIADNIGYETEVVNYLKKHGVKELDFVIATHAHSDHIGSFDTILKNFPTKKLYTREYKDTYIDENGKIQRLFSSEYEYIWDNKTVYNDMINQAKVTPGNLEESSKGSDMKTTEIIYVDGNSPDSMLQFNLGDFKLQIINNNLYNNKEQEQQKVLSGENSNSLGVVVSKGNKKAFLASDIDNGHNNWDEDFLISNDKTKNLIKDVDVFKIAHHGMNGGYNFIKHINPKMTFITGGSHYNDSEEGYKSMTALNIKNVYSTDSNGNIQVMFNDNGTITTDAKVDLSNDGWEKNATGAWTYSKDGKLQTGWQHISYNNQLNWYYFNNKGELLKGWQHIGNKWYYLSDSSDTKGLCGVMLTGFQELSHNGHKSTYFFNNSGEMITGWMKNNNLWYYFNPSGSMATGWLKDNNTWYFLNSNGSMATGWALDNNTWYYLNSSGAMLTGWIKDNNTWYYLHSNGAMATGWLKNNNTWYFLNSNGSMATGWVLNNNTWYFLNSSGAMLTGWQQILYNGKLQWFYFNESGKMLTGEHNLYWQNSYKNYIFDNNGVLIS